MIEPQSGPVRHARREVSPWLVAPFILISALICWGILAPFLGMAIAYPFYDGKPIDFINDLMYPVGNEQMKSLMLLVQGFATFFGLAVFPPLIWRRLTERPIKSLVEGPAIKPITYLIVIGIVIFFIGPNSVFIEWNANLDLPDGAFETWARATEEKAAEVTKFLASFNNFGEYLVGIFVIAVLPGIGEEVTFRGLLQPELQKAFKNAHAGIWLSAIFFSAFHMQFFGFVPRVLLGALFGYLYYWSGNLIVPMFAHFINNAFLVTVMYLGYGDMPGMEENTESMPWYVILLFTVLWGLMIYEFRRQQSNRLSPNDVIAQ